MIFSITSEAFKKHVAEHKSFTHNGMLFQNGTLIKIEVFGKRYTHMLFFNNACGMLMFHDEATNCSFNVAGYVENVISVYNDEFTLHFCSIKKKSYIMRGFKNQYVLVFDNNTRLVLSVSFKKDIIGEEETTICEIDFNSVTYILGDLPLIAPSLNKEQRRIIQLDCESLV